MLSSLAVARHLVDLDGLDQHLDPLKLPCSKGTVARSPMPYPMVHLDVHRVL